MRTTLCVLAGLAAACLAGCGAPVVEVVHELPPPVPLPPDTGLKPGDVAVDGVDEAWIPEYLWGEIMRRLPERVDPDADLRRPLEGRVKVVVEEDSGVRPVRRWGTNAGPARRVELPYLVRRVDIGLVLEIRLDPPRSGTGVPNDLWLETRASYDSTSDPDVRGERGLHRGDDPRRVPPTEEIIRSLIARCVDDAAGMIEPVEMPVTLRFRPAGGAEAAKGLNVAGEREFAAAAEHFRAALEAAPEDAALHFNLGLALEGAGDFAEAAEVYRTAAEASSGQDAEAQEAHRRAAELYRRIEEAKAAES